MHAAPSKRATDWSRERPRTLIVKDGAIWMWPGIPLAMEQGGIVKPLPSHWVRAWISMLHGFEAPHSRIEPALIRASAYLAIDNKFRAQQALDLTKVERLSPEGPFLCVLSLRNSGFLRSILRSAHEAPLGVLATSVSKLPYFANSAVRHLNSKRAIRINRGGRREHLTDRVEGTRPKVQEVRRLKTLQN
jgi:hypothetical protein